MADKLSPLMLTALSRAAAAPAGLPLHGNKALAGLFPTTAAGKQAAQRCQEDGYLCLVCREDSPATNSEAGGTLTLVKKKAAASPLCAITEKGLAHLLQHVSPRQVLEDFVRVLEARRQQADELMTIARQTQQSLEALRINVERVLQHTCKLEGSSEQGGTLKALFAGFLNDTDVPGSASPVPSSDAGASRAKLQEAILAELTRWHHAGASEDCPLPHLYRQVAPSSIGLFHDVLRQLHDAGKVYLHPWTGPLYDIPEPPYALLIGHEIAYYASIRK